MTEVLSIILGGGKGTRLFPLTQARAKPAVPFGGKFRLVDIPISNCINSNLRQIYILTQFNSASLHLHIAQSFIFDSFSKGFVEILAAEQNFDDLSGWYDGTADAVRKNMIHFKTQNPSHYLILSGDQLYRMNFHDLLSHHQESGAAITISCTTVNRETASQLGILKADKNNQIVDFFEKPGPDRDISDFRVPAELQKNKNQEDEYLASMGIYVFNADAMENSLANDFTDFGQEILPMSIKNLKVNAYIFDGYWEDIGTIRSFYDANLDLATIKPKFDIYDEEMPIYTHMRNLPPSKMNFSNMNQSIAAEGCIITNASITNSIIGIRTIIESGASLNGVVCMGADYYESDAQKLRNAEGRVPNVGIGKGSIIKGAIIDKNASIGEGCRIGIDNMDRTDGNYGTYYIIDDIIVIPKNTILYPGTVI